MARANTKKVIEVLKNSGVLIKTRTGRSRSYKYTLEDNEGVTVGTINETTFKQLQADGAIRMDRITAGSTRYVLSSSYKVAARFLEGPGD